MNIIYYLLIAVVVAWISTDFIHLRGSLFFNVLISILGALLSGYYIAPRLGLPVLSAPFNYLTLLVTLGGEALILLIFNFPKLRRPE